MATKVWQAGSHGGPSCAGVSSAGLLRRQARPPPSDAAAAARLSLARSKQHISTASMDNRRRSRSVSLLVEDNHNMDINFQLIQTITNNFAEDQKVGSGGFGDVYRAIYKGEEIAVKKLHPLHGLDDKQFDIEFRNLSKVCHQNVVRLIGYCYESQHKYMEHEGELVFGETVERVLCFEYMQGGSLDKHIKDESCGLEWPTCYKIIKGTCEGINYLHSSRGKPIFHLNLKPGNILLDRSMTPKIANLGLSRPVASTDNRDGTLGFMPPEFVDGGDISKKFDVFSLGVIMIKILAGNNGYYSCSKMSPEQFFELVSENWTKRLQTMMRYASFKEDILRVRMCVEIALRCVATDQNKRPTVKQIIHELEELEANITIMSHLTVQECAMDVENLYVLRNFRNELVD